ncbi:hypothetical protein CANARDRAFT_175509 [[Candida] arabinofermentans NRRL YB-2248]|uniref:tRNA/rRNA methyltransferase SpoU type domain-containing protein n=1 Tax=[Candida] arabinofermentans NRRL YB-2248 TaxID=983967 RepID=A0A1E4T1V7_9ASCO|nr:hypothetical protein CANARDRAFT_175509 [[Candida] arabinofermentans NRRL YB-2248]
MGISSVALLAQSLTLQQQKEIILDLVNKLTTNPYDEDRYLYVSTFCDLIDNVTELKTGIYPTLSKFCLDILSTAQDTNNYDLLLKISEKFDKIPEHLLMFVGTQLKSFAGMNQRLFDQSLIKFTDKDNAIIQSQEESEISLEQWYFIAVDGESDISIQSELDNLCYLYLGFDDISVSYLALNILRWRMDSICQSQGPINILWEAISRLMESQADHEISSGYTLWLRFFNKFGTEALVNDEEFQSVLSNESYWFHLRDGLISRSHEHKKYSLTLIQMSVKSLNQNLNFPIISWDVSKRDEYLENWKKFCTLYEILGIDTAMNQAEAASNDLVRILSPSSKIPVPFALTILAVGFKASLDSVRKYSMNMVFKLPKESLKLFKYDFKFLSSIFLPFTLNANHFSTKKSMTGEYTCEFSEKLSTFVANCIESLEEPEDISILVEQILQVLVDSKLSFDPARIAVLNGILKALTKKHLNVLNTAHLNLLCVLFECQAEGDIFYYTQHTINLRLLLHIDSDIINLQTIFEVIGVFVKNTGFEIFSDNEEFFIDFFNLKYGKDSITELFKSNSSALSLETFIVILSNLIRNKVHVSSVVTQILAYTEVDKLLVGIINSNFEFTDLILEPLITSRLQKLVGDMLEGSKEPDIAVYSSSKKLVSNTILFKDDFWINSDLLPLFSMIASDLENCEDEEQLRYAVFQFDFFKTCIPKCIYNEDFGVSREGISTLLMKAFKSQPKGGDKNFYKVKDRFYGLIMNSYEQLLKINPLDTDFKSEILEVSESLVSHSAYHGHLANVELLSTVIEEDKDFKLADAIVVVDVLSAIWDELTLDRLILSQKDLHHKFISLLVHPTILKYSASDDELAEKIFVISNDIIDKSYARKSLLPRLFRAISEYQISDDLNFGKTLWLSKLLVKGNSFLQSTHNLYRLDMVISDLYDQSLNMSGVGLYEKCYGESEISFKVCINAITASIKSPEFGAAIWDYVLDNDDKFHYLKPVRRTDANEQWQRLQLSILLLLTCKILPKNYYIEKLDKIILPRVLQESSPLCRLYLEWIIAYCIYTYPESKELLFTHFAKDIDQQQPVSLTVFERISFLVARKLNSDDEAKFLEKFIVDTILPSSTTNRALTRHFSVSLISLIYPEILKKNLNIDKQIIAALAGIYNIASKADGFDQFRVGDAMIWDILDDFNLVSINGGVLLKTSDREIDAILEATWEKHLTEEQAEILRIPVGNDHKDEWVKKERSSEVKIETFYSSYDDPSSSLLQTKSGAWSTVISVDANTRAASTIERSPLIVVGSLVDKAPNLGGICRLCDVLGAGWLTLNDIQIKEDPEFKVVAVTADRWMPMIEVKIEDIIEFMRMKKKEGYTLIGLEQTDNSVELNSDLKFPKKSLILLGKEREGIPGDLLAELDMCVIIKQVGVVRSMNIQTATAVIVHAYSSQHC